MKNKIYIFGAHSRAQTLAAYLTYLYSGVSIEAYFYDNEEKNPEKIGIVPVIFMNTETKLTIDYPVFIGTRGVYHQKIEKKLRQIGFRTVYPVTQDLDLKLRNLYLEKYYSSIGRKFYKLNHFHASGNNCVNTSDNLQINFSISENISENIHASATNTKAATLKTEATATVTAVIYVVKSPSDKPLQQEYHLAAYEKEICAGAAFAKNLTFFHSLAESPLSPNILTDDTGDNISDKNKQFCELTALYWLWKHAKEEIIGLAHYRRHFILPEDWKERMLENDIDVILPVPLYVAPSVEENFKSRHDASDWEFMMECLKDLKRQKEQLKKQEQQTNKEINGNFYQTACGFFHGNLYSPCNMFIMKREVLNDLCIWLFPILFHVAEHGGEKDDRYLNRYPGFISERLISLFFEVKRDKYQVVYSDKNFLL